MSNDYPHGNGKSELKYQPDETKAKYRHTRFSVTMVLNIEGKEPGEYTPATTVAINGTSLYHPDDQTRIEYTAWVEQAVTSAFLRLADKWRKQAPLEIADCPAVPTDT